MLNILGTKSALEVKWKVFFIFLKGFQFPKIVSDLRVRLYLNKAKVDANQVLNKRPSSIEPWGIE